MKNKTTRLVVINENKYTLYGSLKDFQIHQRKSIMIRNCQTRQTFKLQVLSI